MQYLCRIGTPDGRVLEEIFTASDETALKSELGKRGYHLFEVRRRGGGGLVPRFALPRFGGTARRKVPIDQFLVFNQELAALLKAGLPLLQALDLMLERMPNPHFKSVLTEVRDQVKSGVDLSEAFAQYGDLFPRLYPSSLKAGERSGELELVIRRFIRYMKLVIEARRRVISALIYPAVLVCLSIAMIVIMTIYVVPKFMVFFENLDAELPFITKAMMATSQFARDNAVAIVLVILGSVVFYRQWKKTESGSVAIDRLRLRLPVLGAVFHRFSLSEMTRSLSTLLAGGIPLVPAFEIAVSSVGNLYVRSKLEPTIQMVREGKPFYAALEASGVFTEMAIDMVKVGETTGSLDEMLTSVSDFLDEQVETRMQRVLSLIEPLMLVFMGLIVATILVSIYLPMFSVLGQDKF
jgi:type IV pilus assembly protein PilC